MDFTAASDSYPDLYRPKRALISVFDKTNLIKLAQNLTYYGIELISTGGTAKALEDAKFCVTKVEDLTHFPEMMEGRVKTLHPAIHGGLLGIRTNAHHQKIMQSHNILPIDIVVVNLYPFSKTLQTTKDEKLIIENIDIGGPAMIRSAAKNHAFVTVITNVEDYDKLSSQLADHEGHISMAFRKYSAAQAFAHSAAYDSAIAQWFAKDYAQQEMQGQFPKYYSLSGYLDKILRYGENPHQNAALYRTEEKRPGVVSATLIQGKPLSYNNINDTDAAFELVCEFSPKESAAVAIIKHANPCGIALGSSPKEAYLRALAGDPLSAFGGIIALNQTIDEECALEISKIFTEVIIAPAISAKAKEVFAKKPNLRILITNDLPSRLPIQEDLLSSSVIKSVAGGFLLQTRDTLNCHEENLKIVSKKAPTSEEMRDMLFAFKIAKHVKSNAIVLAKDGASLGIGAGQMSRVDSVKISIEKAQENAKNDPNACRGSVLASDAFFPFSDGILKAIDAGISAIIQPGGSIRDQEIIECADAHGITMVFTGQRHFRH